MTVLTEGRGRHFNELIEEVQKVLKKVMGLELVQMRAKEGAAGKSKSSPPRAPPPPNRSRPEPGRTR